MKRLIGVILCFSVLMIACNKNKTETTQKDLEKIYVNTMEGLWVRNSPSSDGKQIEFLSYLTEVKITKENDNNVTVDGIYGKWVYITEPIKGWVFNGYLGNIDQIMEASLHKDTNKYINYIMYVNATDGLRVRNSPSSNGEQIGLLKYLTKVNITNEDNNTVNIGGVDGKWAYITEPIEGWIFNVFLENYDQHEKRIEQINKLKEKFIGTWAIIEISPFPKNYSSITLSPEDPKMIFMNELRSSEERDYFYDFEYSGFRGKWNWEVDKKRIKIEGGFLNDNGSYRTGLYDLGEYYLSNINFIDNNHITLYEEIYYTKGSKNYKLERVE
jgi:hypothetical protein